MEEKYNSLRASRGKTAFPYVQMGNGTLYHPVRWHEGLVVEMPTITPQFKYRGLNKWLDLYVDSPSAPTQPVQTQSDDEVRKADYTPINMQSYVISLTLSLIYPWSWSRLTKYILKRADIWFPKNDACQLELFGVVLCSYALLCDRNLPNQQATGVKMLWVDNLEESIAGVQEKLADFDLVGKDSPTLLVTVFDCHCHEFVRGIRAEAIPMMTTNVHPIMFKHSDEVCASWFVSHMQGLWSITSKVCVCCGELCWMSLDRSVTAEMQHDGAHSSQFIVRCQAYSN